MEFINLTPHTVRLNNGTEFPSMGVAMGASSYSSFDDNGIATVNFGFPIDLPDKKPGVYLIVSELLLQAFGAVRPDLVAPATGHPETIWENGQVVSVPGFVR
ncbi:MAG: hypothetical protein HQL77_18945 [Magnetococcales bacterium]|nr:hypothetical protein [Magnetococcales bacterium]